MAVRYHSHFFDIESLPAWEQLLTMKMDKGKRGAVYTWVGKV